MMKSVQGSGSALRIITSMPFTQDLSLIPKLICLRPSLNSDIRILSTLHLKHLPAINMFASWLAPIFPAPLLLYELSFSKGSMGALRVIVSCNIARQRIPLASERSILPCLKASEQEICQNLSCDEICPQVRLRTQNNNKHALHTRSFLATQGVFFLIYESILIDRS